MEIGQKDPDSRYCPVMVKPRGTNAVLQHISVIEKCGIYTWGIWPQSRASPSETKSGTAAWQMHLATLGCMFLQNQTAHTGILVCLSCYCLIVIILEWMYYIPAYACVYASYNDGQVEVSIWAYGSLTSAGFMWKWAPCFRSMSSVDKDLVTPQIRGLSGAHNLALGYGRTNKTGCSLQMASSGCCL